MEPEAPPESQPVVVTSVVRGLGAGGAVRITVHGTWRGASGGPPAVLVVDDGERRHVVAALTVEPPDDPSEFRAAFDLPADLGGVAADGFVLSIGGTEIPLPAALPGVPQAPVRDVAAQAPAGDAEIFDRAVLAEHRARRAEQGLEGVSERLRALEAHLAEVTGERDRLRDELEEARAAEERRLGGLQDQVAGLRESATAAEELQAALGAAREAHEADAAALTAAREELAALREEHDALREELDVVRAERDGLREAVERADPAHPEPAAGLAELGETARRLREQAEEELAARAQGPPKPEHDPFDLALAELRARTAPPPAEGGAPVIPLDPLRNTMDLAAMSPGRRARSRLRRVMPQDRHVVHPEALEAQRRSGVPWLASAIDLLAAEDIPSAGAFLVALLPDAARTLDGDLVYDLDLDGVGAFRVRLAGGRGTVAMRGEGARSDAAFRIGGSIARLAPLGAGGAPRRLGGARVSGSRRALRRLLRARRDPVDLGDLAAAGVVPDPELLLRALAAAVRPSWTGDEEYAVAIDVPGHEPITVVAEPGRRLQVAGAPPSGGAVRAVLATSPAALLALLGRVEPPEGDDAMLTGEEAVMDTLLELLDRAQGLPPRS